MKNTKGKAAFDVILVKRVSLAVAIMYLDSKCLQKELK